MEKKPKYTQCLVTNAVPMEDDRNNEEDERRFSYEQALVLAHNFTTGQLTALTKIKATPEELNHTWKFVKRITGVDLRNPVDEEGVVTSASLNALSAATLKMIAETFQIKKSNTLKKEELVTKLLLVHPRAKRPTTSRGVLRRATDLAQEQLTVVLKNKKQQASDMQKRFLPESKKPKFVETYTAYYGLQDRMNDILYANFRHTTCPTPHTKAAWSLLFITVFNSYSTWVEMNASCSKTSKNVPVQGRSSCPVARFTSQLALQLAEWCLSMDARTDIQINRRSSTLSSSSSDEDTA